MLGLVEQAKPAVLMLTNLAIICFSTVEFNLMDVFPLGGSKITTLHGTDKGVVLVFTDRTNRVVLFNSVLDKGIWL